MKKTKEKKDVLKNMAWGMEEAMREMMRETGAKRETAVEAAEDIMTTAAESFRDMIDTAEKVTDDKDVSNTAVLLTAINYALAALCVASGTDDEDDVKRVIEMVTHAMKATVNKQKVIMITAHDDGSTMSVGTHAYLVTPIEMVGLLDHVLDNTRQKMKNSNDAATGIMDMLDQMMGG